MEEPTDGLRCRRALAGRNLLHLVVSRCSETVVPVGVYVVVMAGFGAGSVVGAFWTARGLYLDRYLFTDD